MKTIEEIKEELKRHKEVRDFINPSIEDGNAFAFQEGFICGLEWVLKDYFTKE